MLRSAGSPLQLACVAHAPDLDHNADAQKVHAINLRFSLLKHLLDFLGCWLAENGLSALPTFLLVIRPHGTQETITVQVWLQRIQDGVGSHIVARVFSFLSLLKALQLSRPKLFVLGSRTNRG